MSEKLLEYFKNDELASSAWAKKYKQENEETPDDMHRRLAKEFARVESNYIKTEKGSSNTLSKYGKERKDLTEERIFNLFKDFKYVIPQGSVMSNLGGKAITSLSNCLVVASPEDSYGGIFKADQELAQLMKRRAGVGLDISTLRPEGTTTSNAAKTSTGAISFMHRFSNTTREVAQNGRRGALMLSISINHPDVLKFIKIKRDLSQVTGANISVKLNDEFMKAVENDERYVLRFPCDFYEKNPHWVDDLERSKDWDDVELNKLYPIAIHEENVTKILGYTKIIKAKEYWNQIIKSAHNVAEPGLMFWDNMVDYSPDGAYPQFKQVTTNPCSEIAMQPYDACRLIAVNLFSFVDKPFTTEAIFNYQKFYEINYEAMRLSDDLIDLELEHINRIIEKVKKDPERGIVKTTEVELWKNVKKTAMASRRTGLGFTALGDTLAALGLKYDSDEALDVVESIMMTKMESELDCTTDLAILRGTFEGWDKNKEFKHNDDAELEGMNDFYKFICDNFPKLAKRLYYYGRRNVSFSTVAPTGTVSLLAQTTSGIEPLFQPFYIRRKKVNRDDKDARVDFTDQNGDTWQEFPVLHPKFKDFIVQGCDGIDVTDSLDKGKLDRWFHLSPWYGSTANDIDWVKRVRMQSIIQKYVTHSISSTINLPEDVTKEEVSEIYLESWKQGLKGITVYRDGSRSGVLISDKKVEDDFTQNDAPKRPEELECDVFTTVSKGVKWNVFVGLYSKKPYEVFATPHFTTLSNGYLKKIKRGRYDFNTVENETYSEDITSEMNNEQEVITRLISTALRHGADIKFIVEQLNKSHGDITSFNKAIARTLKKYIPEGSKSTVSCNECNSTDVIFEEGCHKCLSCGASACG